MEHQTWLSDALVFLLAVGVVVPVFHHFRLGAVLGFIAAGVIVGPFGLGRFQFELPLIRYLVIDDPENVEPFADLGVVFLLFVLGLELSFAKLWELRRYVLGAGSAQVAVSALGIGAAAALIGANSHAATVIGLALAMSSTAIVMQLLVEQRRLATQPGRIALSVLLLQDLTVVPILVIVGMLARGAANGIGLELALALGKSVAAVAVILLAGRFVLRPMLRQAAMTGSRELIMAIVLLAVVGASVGTGAAGLSAELGAFLAGLLLAESEYKHQIEVDIDPFKGLLLGLFFTTVGMSIDLAFVASALGWIALAVFCLLLFKAAVLFAACRLFGVGLSSAAETAILLGQAGEFGFVVVGLARSGDIMSAELAQFVVVIIGLSMMATPLLGRLGSHASARLELVEHRDKSPRAIEESLADHVVIGGFGRVGQMVARVLEGANVPYVALDRNASVVAEQRRLGRIVFFGDAAQQEILAKAGADRALAFIVTVDSPIHAEHMIRAALRRRPDVPIYARARDAEHAVALRRIGASGVVPEAVERSLQLAARVLKGLDFPEDAILTRLERERETERAALDISAEHEQAEPIGRA